MILSTHDAVQPDFLFIRAERAAELVRERRMRVAPHLVVEVLSPGNSAEEMAKKRAMYGRGGVPEYVEVDPATRSIALYRLVDDAYGAALVYHEDDMLTLRCLRGLKL